MNVFAASLSFGFLNVRNSNIVCTCPNVFSCSEQEELVYHCSHCKKPFFHRVFSRLSEICSFSLFWRFCGWVSASTIDPILLIKRCGWHHSCGFRYVPGEIYLSAISLTNKPQSQWQKCLSPFNIEPYVVHFWYYVPVLGLCGNFRYPTLWQHWTPPLMAFLLVVLYTGPLPLIRSGLPYHGVSLLLPPK